MTDPAREQAILLSCGHDFMVEPIYEALVIARADGASEARITNDEVILIRECVRTLDSGHLHCRYCRAEFPDWDHSEHCPYADSVRKVEQARTILDRVQGVALRPTGTAQEGEAK
jgi:hypothetical protein